MVVPNVPAGAAVYMRIKKAQNYRVQKYKFAGSEASELTLIPVDKKNTNDPDEWIAAIKNSGETKKNLTLSFVGYCLLLKMVTWPDVSCITTAVPPTMMVL